MNQILLSPWTGPYGGVPPFDKAKVEDFKPALLAGIEENRAEIAAIASNPAPPDFENTIAALEESGRALHRVGVVFGVFASTMNDKAMQAVEMEMAPVLAAFSDEVIHNGALFDRVKIVYEARETSGLTAEQNRLVWVVYRNFARHGAALGEREKTRLAAINQRLATLYTEFAQNVLGDEEEQFLVLESEADLAGLSQQQRQSAAAMAETKGLKGKWAISNTRSDIEPFLIYAARRDLREKAFRLWTSRGDGPAHDNKPVIGEILALRSEKAKLLGFPTFAHWVTDDQMAKTPDAAMALMRKVWKPAAARVREEVAEMQKLAVSEGGTFKIAPWDYRYYAEKVRQAKYAIDQNAIKHYLVADRIIEAAFWAAGELYGFEFKEIHDVPIVMPDVRVFELRKHGKSAGLFYLDPFARGGKLSGAWMSEYRTQERLKGETTPIVSNNANFMNGGGEVLISWDDAVTIFHEFGHALHALNSAVTYPSLSGTNVVRDFVEFPSQLNERWLSTPELLSRFARHHETGEPMPDALIAKIRNAHKFNQGFATIEYLSSAIVDMEAHLAESVDAHAFEDAALREIGMPDEVVMRHRLPHFTHIFAGEGYASGYYNYIWADTLVADAAEAFREAPGGFYDAELARRLHDDIISVGNTVDAGDAFRRFRGRDVAVEALMRDRGFPT
jgi:peptidyl-dipeptidase Dcp